MRVAISNLLVDVYDCVILFCFNNKTVNTYSVSSAGDVFLPPFAFHLADPAHMSFKFLRRLAVNPFAALIAGFNMFSSFMALQSVRRRVVERMVDDATRRVRHTLLMPDHGQNHGHFRFCDSRLDLRSVFNHQNKDSSHSWFIHI
jgi:hypothetical protein